MSWAGHDFRRWGKNAIFWTSTLTLNWGASILYSFRPLQQSQPSITQQQKKRLMKVMEQLRATWVHSRAIFCSFRCSSIDSRGNNSAIWLSRKIRHDYDLFGGNNNDFFLFCTPLVVSGCIDFSVVPKMTQPVWKRPRTGWHPDWNRKHLHGWIHC